MEQSAPMGKLDAPPRTSVSRIVPSATLLKMKAKSAPSPGAALSKDSRTSEVLPMPSPAVIPKPIICSKMAVKMDTASDDQTAAQVSLFALRTLLQVSQQEQEQQQQQQQQEQQQEQQQQQHLQQILGDSVRALKGLLNVNATVPPAPGPTNKVHELFLCAAMQKCQQEQQQQQQSPARVQENGNLKVMLLRAAQKKQQQQAAAAAAAMSSPPTTYSSVLKKESKQTKTSAAQKPSSSSSTVSLKSSVSASIIPQRLDMSTLTPQQVRNAEKLAKEIVDAKKIQLPLQQSQSQSNQQAQHQNKSRAPKAIKQAAGMPVDRFAGSAFLSSPDPTDMPIPDFL